MRQIEEAIELLEKNSCVLSAIYNEKEIPMPDDLEKLSFNNSEALAKLKEQPPAGEFREIVNNRFPVFLPDSYEGMKSLCAELTDTVKEACDIIDQKDKLLFAYESVRAPKQPPTGERILEERIEKLSDCFDRSEASRKDLRDNLKMLVALLCHPGSFVSAEDIEKAKVAIEKEGGE